MEMNSPPFIGADDPELLALPPNVRADYEMGMQGREFTGWLDGVPCFWLTDDNTCKYHDHKPEICLDFEPGSQSCRDWRNLITRS
jgi:Fe-S-cluster containining protein